MSSHDIEALTQRTRRTPTQAPAWLALGTALRAEGRAEEAADALLQAVRLRPSWPEASYQLGLALDALGELDGASTCFERACQLAPSRYELRRRLAFSCVRRGDAAAAVLHYQQALGLRPNSIESLLELSAVELALGQVDEAIAHYRRALILDPSQHEVHNDLGNALYRRGQVEQALSAYRAAIAVAPDFAAAHANLGNALKDVALHDEAASSYRRALELEPGNAVTHANYVFTLGYNPRLTARALCAEAREFGRRHTEPLRGARRPHDNSPEPERKLRIGYLSSDFREHVAMYYLEPLLAQHDRRAVEIYCYSNVFPPDAWTERCRRHADVFRDIWSSSDEQAAAQIRRDGVDILVDLSMHTSNARPLLVARKPAPVQLCWLAYVGTTGNDAVDYRISDPYLDPADSPLDVYTERTLRLPRTFWCYAPPVCEVPVSPLPALSTAQVTFGYLGSFCKLNDQVLALWARVLAGVKGSRLLLHVPLGAARERTLAVLERAGVAPGAVQLVERLSRTDYLNAHAQVDICLDTLPYNGLSNTLDAAWMGVPTVTLSGETVVGRAGASVAMNLGLPGLVARTPDELVEAATRLAGDRLALSGLRMGLRARLRASPLMDAPRFARDFEAAYRRVWREWCGSAPARET